ncbi:BRD4-interacting chromatin-remodeling complex-associated protein [Salix suchowensis]|nr:BRD4-interacting chromatin-remodeling complex-associated protein [Salix suchowensis]
MSWLWNSTIPRVCGPYMFLNTTKDVWDAIKTKFSMTKQGNMMVIEYYYIMKSFWLELDYYQDFKMKCSDDAIILKNYIERERIFEFFAGLNMELDQVKIQILGKEFMPSLNEATATNTEGSAMMITHSRNDVKNDAEGIKTKGRNSLKKNSSVTTARR